MRTSLPFELRGVPGRVDVEYGTNDDPERWGYPLLGLEPLVERSRGCPVVAATVEHPAEGYAAVMGWIQLVRDRAGADERVLVDVAPQMEIADARMPYFSFGVRPTLFDAPSTDDPEYEFSARAFLVVAPDAVMSPAVEPLCGFRWGYSVIGARPEIAPLEVAGAADWAAARSELEARYPAWSFGDFPSR
jgi:hypothetical protein